MQTLSMDRFIYHLKVPSPGVKENSCLRVHTRTADQVYERNKTDEKASIIPRGKWWAENNGGGGSAKEKEDGKESREKMEEQESNFLTIKRKGNTRR